MNQNELKEKQDNLSKALIAIERWWNRLNEQPGEKAQLRRCHSATEVELSAPYFNFLLSLKGIPIPMRNRLPIIAGVLAHVKSNDLNQTIAESMGKGETPKVSNLRFRKFINIESDNELYVAMIRIVRLLDGRVNIHDIIKSILYWNERTRKDWAYLYYTGKNLNESMYFDTNQEAAIKN